MHHQGTVKMRSCKASCSSIYVRSPARHSLPGRSHLGCSRPHPACGRSLAGEAHRHRQNHQASCHLRKTLHHHGDVLHLSHTSRLHSPKIPRDRIQMTAVGARNPRIPAGGHIPKTPAGDRIQSFQGGYHIQSSLADGRNRTVPDLRTLDDRIRSFLGDHHNRSESPHRICALDRSRQRRETDRSRQSGAWETGSCSSYACAPAREIESVSGAFDRQNLNDACQHRHPSLRLRYRISSCFASSLPSRASSAPSSGVSRTSPHHRNRRRPSRSSWICGTYHDACC